MLAVNDKAPDFSIATINGFGTFKLSDYIGKVVVISISGLTWCGYCRQEAPILERVWQAKKGNDIQFISATKDGGSSTERVRNAVEDFGITFPVIRRTDAKMNDYKGDYVPLMYILTRDHKVHVRHTRAVTNEIQFSDEIDRCLAAPAPNTEVGRGCGMVLVDLFRNIGRPRR